MKTILYTLLLFSFCISVTGCGSDSHTETGTVTVTQSDAGTTVSLHQNQTIKVSLQGNGTTGYFWDVVPGAESILTQQGDPEFIADSSAVGAGGTYTFTFKATGSGTAALNLIYHRPFDTGVPPVRTFGITVSVAE